MLIFWCMRGGRPIAGPLAVDTIRRCVLVLLRALPSDRRMWDPTRPMLAGLVDLRLGDSIQEWATAILDECRGDDDLIVVGSSVGDGPLWRSPDLTA